MTPPPDAFVAYHPDLERPAPDEANTIAAIDAALATVRERTYADGGRPLRSVHAKSHGLLVGRLRIADGLPPAYAQGLFASAGDYPVVLRLSTTPGDLLDDAVSTPRGVAMKVVGVPGECVPGHAGTQDFVFVNAPGFNAPSLKAFLQGVRLVAATTDRAPEAKKVLSAVMRRAEAVVEAFGGRSAQMLALGGQPATHPLGETYHTQVPLRHGAHVAKLSLAPACEGLRALHGAPVDLAGHPDALREAVVAHFAAHGGTWSLRAQLCTDPEAMPIEDGSVVWPEALSPHVTVGTVTVAPQAAWTPERAAAVDDGMLFSPWHALAAHQPLGQFMRARRLAYERSAHFRALRLGRPITEPTHLDHL